MTKFTLTHEIQCAPEAFWKIFFDKEFNQQLFLQGLGFPAFSVVEQRESDREIYRKVEGTPKLSLPGPVAKLFGSNMGYVEQGTFDKSTQVWIWKLIPSAMGDKIRTEGTIRVEPAGDGKCRRIGEFAMEAKIFGVGGMIESSGEKSMREGWDKSAEFTNQWIRDGKAK